MASHLLTLAPFDGEQLEIAEAILAQFRRAGLDNIGLAAVANAWAESMLDPVVCYGRTPWGADRGFGPIEGMEDSCGLFQLNAAPNAAGAGMSAASRMDAAQNTARIIEVIQGASGAELRSAANSGASLGELIILFTVDIERPADSQTKGEERAADAESWGWPIDEPPPKASTLATAMGTLPLIIVAVVALVAVVAMAK